MTQTLVEAVAIPATMIPWDGLPSDLPANTKKAVDDAVAMPEAPPTEKGVDALTDQTTTTKRDPPPPKTAEEKPAATTIEAQKVGSSYLKVFRGFIRGSGDSDPFIHRMPRSFHHITAITYLLGLEVFEIQYILAEFKIPSPWLT
jgi:hypothetical protein